MQTINLNNERRAFEYHLTVRMGNPKRMLAKDPDRKGFYQDPIVNAMWTGLLIGLERFTKRARSAND